MKEKYRDEKEQWIPWEISYSLKEISRKNKNGDPVTSKSNAMLAVVLPDEKDSYSYYLETKDCCESRCTMHSTYVLFTIIRKNKFNYKEALKEACATGHTIWYGESSYIEAVKWSDFINDYSKYIDSACKRQDNINDYEICKEV